MSDFLNDPPPRARCHTCWNHDAWCTCHRQIVSLNGKRYEINQTAVDGIFQRAVRREALERMAAMTRTRETATLTRADLERMAGGNPSTLFAKYMERNVTRLEHFANGED